MVSNKKETIDVMISRFNKNQKTNSTPEAFSPSNCLK
jgi:hypothetical protein